MCSMVCRKFFVYLVATVISTGKLNTEENQELAERRYECESLWLEVSLQKLDMLFIPKRIPQSIT